MKNPPCISLDIPHKVNAKINFNHHLLKVYYVVSTG